MVTGLWTNQILETHSGKKLFDLSSWPSHYILDAPAPLAAHPLPMGGAASAEGTDEG